MPPKDPDDCSHSVMIGAKITGGFSDEDVRVYVCSKCGFPMLAARINKFKHNPAAKAFFKKMAEEIELDMKIS